MLVLCESWLFFFVGFGTYLTNLPFKIHQVQYLQEINSVLKEQYCPCVACACSHAGVTMLHRRSNHLTVKHGKNTSIKFWILTDWQIPATTLLAQFTRRRGKPFLALTYDTWPSRWRKMQFLNRYKLPENLKANENSFFPGKKLQTTLNKIKRSMSCLSDVIRFFKNETQHE